MKRRRLGESGAKHPMGHRSSATIFVIVMHWRSLDGCSTLMVPALVALERLSSCRLSCAGNAAGLWLTISHTRVRCDRE